MTEAEKLRLRVELTEELATLMVEFINDYHETLTVAVAEGITKALTRCLADVHGRLDALEQRDRW